MKDHKLSLMAIGHEIWLGEAKTSKSGVELSLLYGHNMKQDGSLDPKRITPLVYTPARRYPDSCQRRSDTGLLPLRQ